MNLTYIHIVFIVLIVKFSWIESKLFFVCDYGAYANDDRDDTKAIQTAIDDAINADIASEIDFGSGIYKISSTIMIVNATNITIKGVGMDQTFLIGYEQVAIFYILYSQGIKLTGFSIDYDPLPFTAGYVVDVNDNYLDVKIVEPHQADVGRQVQAILRYDPAQMRPAFGSNTYEMSQTPPEDVKTTIVSPGVLRLPLKSSTQFVKGDPIVARYLFTAYGIYGQDIVDFTIQSVTIYTAWSMSFVTLRPRRLNIIDYYVLLRNGRWMSSVADCIHSTDARESIFITDSKCQGMGDDGLNVHATFFLVTEIFNSSAIIIEATNWTYSLEFGVGTTLEFSSNREPFTVHGNGKVATFAYNSTNSRKITFTNPVNVNLGDWVCVADTPSLTIRNFTASQNRARGVLLETRNIDIRQSVFNRTSGPAVLVQPSMFWSECPEARNISLINNIYIENNEGIAREYGIISILPDPPQLIPVIDDIRIESSTFYFGTYTQGLLQSDNSNNVFLNGNYIAVNSSSPLISICNSRNISAQNNCVVNSGKTIDQYFTFDINNPCLANLSSLIDLPPSAFNSSFPPPI